MAFFLRTWWTCHPVWLFVEAPSCRFVLNVPGGFNQEDTVLCLWYPVRTFCLSYLTETMRNTSRVTPWIPARRKK